MYDIVVIGGGIHGAGVAQAAAALGYNVLVLEQSTVASGTSSRSSKLIHGGLRYLESMQFNLVKECLQEREILLEIAPDLVELKQFYIPVYKQTKRSAWQIKLGLRLYRLLGGGQFGQVPHQQWDQLDGLRTDDLQSVFSYWDAQTDDVALTNAVMQSACELGAELLVHTPVTAINLVKHSAEITYQSADQYQTVAAKVVINAAGPWVNQVLQQVNFKQTELPIHWIQGTHLLLTGTTIEHLYYLEAPQDQRAVFILAYQGEVLLGTTETHYQGKLQNIQPYPEEIEYLQQIFQYYFPQQIFSIKKAFAGLRVLPVGTGSAFARPRETRLLMADNTAPLCSVYGGKLTAYRATAERVMAKILPYLPSPSQQLDTRQIKVTRNK